MARKLFERQAIRRRTGALAAGVAMVVYTDAAGTVLADISTTVGGSAIAGSTVTTANIAGFGPAALQFWGPPDGTDTLYIRVPSDTSLGVQEIEAATDPRLDALESGSATGIPGSIFDAKGDIIAATAADTAARFAAGSNGKVLAADSTQTSGLKWIVNEGPLWLTDPRVNAAGGGADDTTPIQTGLTLTDGAGALGIPPGTWKAGTLTYRNQNITGLGRTVSILKGKPGEDILRADQTLSEFDRDRFYISDLQLLLDDSTDASGSFSRGGVGNAALAYPCANGASIPLGMVHPWLRNVYITSLSGTVRGQNKSCGVYLQVGAVVGRFGPGLEFGRLVYGYWMDTPAAGLASMDYFSDHNWWDGVHCSYNGTALRLLNMSYTDFAALSFHENGNAFLGVQNTGSLGPNNWGNNTFGSIFIEGTVTTPITLPGTGHAIDTLRIQGPHGAITLDCSNSEFRELWLSTLSGTNTPPVLNLTGHRNKISAHLHGSATTAYLRDMVSDTGRGNKVTISNLWGGSTLNQRLQVNRDGRTLHERDTHSIQLGYATPPFVSGRDLLVNPLNIVPTGGVEGTDFSWVADTATDLGHRLRILGTSGSFFAQGINGTHVSNSFNVGDTLPAGKVRIYVKAKVATGGTQVWTLNRISGVVVLGTATLTWTTSYTVQSFDADLTGQTAGEALQLATNSVGGGGAAPLDIAWVAFRPYHKDLLIAGRIEEGLSAHGAAGSTETFDLTAGTVHTATLDANLTATFTGAVSGRACSMSLILTQDGTGSRTVTWPASVDWPAGTAPVLSTAAGKVDVFSFISTDGGTTWLGFVGGLDLR